jgi:hypothetical protein
MPEHRRPLKVFLSYASQDKPLVRELSHQLVGEGWIDTWQDEKNLLPGQDWRVKIEEAVEEADVVIIVLSQHSVSKEGYVQKELRYAREIALEKPEDTIFLIPLRLDECEVPRGLRFYQWVDYFEDKKDDSYKALVASLRLRYEQKLKAEEEERLRREQQERETAEKAAREKKEKEAAEKARLQAEEEERKRIAKEKAELDAADKMRLEAEEKAKQKAAREKAEREVAEKAVREKEKREAAEKVKRESAERRTAQIVKLKATLSKSFVSFILNLSKAIPSQRVVSFAGITVFLFLLGIWGFPKLALLSPATNPSLTITPIPPTKTFTPTPTKTYLVTSPPTVILTPTSITPIRVFFHRDFEDGAIGEWSSKDGVWVIEKEPDGNRCLSGSGPAGDRPQIWYKNEQTHWTDYALETRVKFIEGYTSYIFIRSDIGSDEHYGAGLNENGFYLMKSWSTIGDMIPILPVPNRWYTIKLEINGDSLSAYIDDVLVQELKLQPPVINEGGIGFVIDGEDKVCLDDIWAWH